ncbi:MAG: MBL fold metallo-hydrolase [Parachlamydiales bacterium]
MVEIKVFTSGPLSTNGYLVLSEGEGALIDCPPGSAPSIMQEGKGIGKILLTHSHWDHIADCGELADHFGAEVYIHPEDAENLRHPGADGLTPIIGAIAGREPDHLLSDGEEIKVGGITFRVLHTPGHAPGLVCFYCEEEGILFCGDLLFRGAIGSLSLPTSEPERMGTSLERIARLPPETVIYSGHGPKTTVGREKEIY